MNALVEKGNQVTLVSLPDHQVHQNKINSNVQIEYLPFYGNKGYYFNAFALRKIYKKSKPDIVNVHYASGYGLGPALQKYLILFFLFGEVMFMIFLIKVNGK